MSASGPREPSSDDGSPPDEVGGPIEIEQPDETGPVEAAMPAARLRRLRTPVGAALLLVVVAIVYYLASFVDVWAASRAEYQQGNGGRGREAAVVLGAAQYNGEPSPVLKARLDEAAELYESGEVSLIVLTGGGQAADITTEAKSGYDYLRERSGIPDERLRLEVQGGSTYESLAATARFLRQENVERVVLVTDRYHVKRSSLIAQEVGLIPRAAPTPQSAPFDRLAQEAAAVAVGRIISFRRLDQI